MLFKRKKQPEGDQKREGSNPESADSLSDTGRRKRPTLKLGSRGFASVADMTPAPEGMRQGGEFVTVPTSAAAKADHADLPQWRIELRTAHSGDRPLRLHIVGDVVLGLKASADIALDEYDAAGKGVSRRHVLLRPTSNHLYLIELGSTNGTLLNGLPLGAGMARPLRSEDVITLAQLRLTVRLHSEHVTRQNVSVVDMYMPDVLNQRDPSSRRADEDDVRTGPLPPVD